MGLKIIRGWASRNGVEDLETDLQMFLEKLGKPAKIIPLYAGKDRVLVFVKWMDL